MLNFGCTHNATPTEVGLNCPHFILKSNQFPSRTIGNPLKNRFLITDTQRMYTLLIQGSLKMMNLKLYILTNETLGWRGK